MELKITTKLILKLLYFLSWLIFVGLGIEAGGIIYNGFYTLTYQSFGAHNFWNGIDLSNLYNYDSGHFLVILLYMAIPAILKAILFYLIIKILQDKNFDIDQLFSEKIRRFINLIACLSLGIGLFSGWGANYTEWLVSKGVKMPEIQHLGLGGADVWLFMAVTLFVISQIFKRGIEIQNEHDLTV